MTDKELRVSLKRIDIELQKYGINPDSQNKSNPEDKSKLETNSNGVGKEVDKLEKNSNHAEKEADKPETNSNVVGKEVDKLEKNSNHAEKEADKPETNSNHAEKEADKPETDSNHAEKEADKPETNSNHAEKEADKPETNSNHAEKEADKPETNSNVVGKKIDKLEINSNHVEKEADKHEANSNKVGKETDTVPTSGRGENKIDTLKKIFSLFRDKLGKPIFSECLKNEYLALQSFQPNPYHDQLDKKLSDPVKWLKTESPRKRKKINEKFENKLLINNDLVKEKSGDAINKAPCMSTDQEAMVSDVNKGGEIISVDGQIPQIKNEASPIPESGLQKNVLSKDLKSEVQVIKELQHKFVKIERPYIYRTGGRELCRSDNIEMLINDNKTVTIDIEAKNKQKNDQVERIDAMRKESDSDSDCEIVFVTKRRKTDQGPKKNSCKIKVKPPHALGIACNGESSVPKESSSLLKNVQLHELSHTCTSTVGEVCKLYPYFLTSEVKQIIPNLIKILFKVFNKVTKLTEFQNFQSIIGNYSKMFIETFNTIIDKFSEIDPQQSLLRKMIPIIYLQITKAFQILRPNSDEIVWNIITEMINNENSPCEHDILRQKNYKESRSFLSIYERWVEDVFTLDDLSGLEDSSMTLDPDDNGPDNSQNEDEDYLSDGLFSPDSLEGETEAEDPSSRIDPGQTQSTAVSSDTTRLPSKMFGFSDDLTTLKCHVCQKEVTVACYICQEPISCSNFCEIEQPEGDPNFYTCEEHRNVVIGNNWSQERDLVEDHDMAYDPRCWNVGCNKKAMILCICKRTAYCSFPCKEEDWTTDHYKTCLRHTDPDFYLSPDRV